MCAVRGPAPASKPYRASERASQPARQGAWRCERLLSPRPARPTASSHVVDRGVDAGGLIERALAAAHDGGERLGVGHD
jgi:hypothetical protein